MAVIGTETSRLSNLIKKFGYYTRPELHNEMVTVNEASQTTYTLGTVLGKITANGKYIVSKQAAVDGSQVPAAIYIGDTVGLAQTLVIAAATDTSVLALARGAVVVSIGALALDATFASAPQKAFAYASLKAQGILCEATV